MMEDDSNNGDDAEMQVVEQLPVVKQEDLEDNESRKSSMASTQVPMKKRRNVYIENIDYVSAENSYKLIYLQWSWPSDNEERPPIPLKKTPTAGFPKSIVE